MSDYTQEPIASICEEAVRRLVQEFKEVREENEFPITLPSSSSSLLNSNPATVEYWADDDQGTLELALQQIEEFNSELGMKFRSVLLYPTILSNGKCFFSKQTNSLGDRLQHRLFKNAQAYDRSILLNHLVDPFLQNGSETTELHRSIQPLMCVFTDIADRDQLTGKIGGQRITWMELRKKREWQEEERSQSQTKSRFSISRGWDRVKASLSPSRNRKSPKDEN